MQYAGSTNISINVNLNDLKAFARYIAEETRKEVEEQAKVEAQDKQLTSKEAAQMLNVTASTLWRWEKENYLVPAFRVGRKAFYTISQIQNLKNGVK